MAKIQTLPWDPAEYLKTEEDVVAYWRRRTRMAILI